MQDIITAYQTLFKSLIASANPTDAIKNIKTVYRWEPDKIPQDSTPAITIEGVQTSYTPSVQYDRRDQQIRITVVTSVKDTYWADIADRVSYKHWLVDLVEGLSLTDTDVRADTVVWVINQHPCLDIVKGPNTLRVVNEVVNIQVQYQNRMTDWYVAYEAVITFTALGTGKRFST